MSWLGSIPTDTESLCVIEKKRRKERRKEQFLNISALSSSGGFAGIWEQLQWNTTLTLPTVRVLLTPPWKTPGTDGELPNQVLHWQCFHLCAHKIEYKIISASYTMILPEYFTHFHLEERHNFLFHSFWYKHQNSVWLDIPFA